MSAGRLQYLSLFLLITVGDALRTDTSESGPLPAWPPQKEEATEAKKPPVITGKHVDDMVADWEDQSPVATPESNAPSFNLKKHVKDIAEDWGKSSGKKVSIKKKAPAAGGEKHVSELAAKWEAKPEEVPQKKASVGKSRVKKMAAEYQVNGGKGTSPTSPKRAPKKLSKVWPPPSDDATEAEDSSPSLSLKKHVKDMASDWEKKPEAVASEPAEASPKYHVKGDKTWMKPEALDEEEVIDNFLKGGKAEDLPEIDAGGKHVKDIAKNFQK